MIITSDIISYYSNQNEDVRLTANRAHKLEYITTIHYLDKILKPKYKILDACAGTGAYCFDLAEKGFEVTAGDLVQSNVDMIIEKNNKKPLLKKIYTGNILDLSQFADGSFDITLCLGAFYHLHDKGDRIQALKECSRVTKSKGYIAIAYLNRFASFMNNFTYHPENFDSIISEFYSGSKNVFYRSTPIEIEKNAMELGITKVYNVAADGVSYIYPKQLEQLTEVQFNKYLEYHFNTCQNESTLAYSLHGLFIGRKSITIG